MQEEEFQNPGRNLSPPQSSHRMNPPQSEQFYTTTPARDLSPAVLHLAQTAKEALQVETKLAESLELQGYY